MVHWNLLPLPLLYLSAYFEHNRAQYYDLLLARPVLSIPDAQQMLDVSYPTAHNLIGKLTAVNILSPLSESTYGKLYAADEILEILQ
jgi:Fic family protein